MKVAVIDYGMGNIGSICNMLKYIGTSHVVSSDFDEIRQCEKIVLPGVGHFGLAMQNLHARHLVGPLQQLVVEDKVPILGICLGMQLLCSFSEEGNTKGLGFIDAEVRKFQIKPASRLKIPQMGWATVSFKQQNSMSTGLGDEARFYFVHSYYVDCRDDSDIWGVSEYGQEFVSAFVRSNIVGVQFHPEKSHKYGIQLFRNFVGQS